MSLAEEMLDLFSCTGKEHVVALDAWIAARRSPEAYIRRNPSVQNEKTAQLKLILAFVAAQEYDRAYELLQRCVADRNTRTITENELLYMIKEFNTAGELEYAYDTYSILVRLDKLTATGIASMVEVCKLNKDPEFITEVVLMDAQRHGVSLDSATYANVLYSLNTVENPIRQRSAEQIFDQMVAQGRELDTKVLNAMLLNFQDSSLEEVFDIVNLFHQKGIEPNLRVFTTLLVICARKGAEEYGNTIFATMEKQKLPLDAAAFIPMLHLASHSVDQLVAVFMKAHEYGITFELRMYRKTFSKLAQTLDHTSIFQVIEKLQQEKIPIPFEAYIAWFRVLEYQEAYADALGLYYELLCKGFPVAIDLVEPVVFKCFLRSEAEKAFELLRLLSLDSKIPPFSLSVYRKLEQLFEQYEMHRESRTMWTFPQLQSLDQYSPISESKGRMTMQQVYHDTKLQLDSSIDDLSIEQLREEIRRLIRSQSTKC